MPTFRSHAPPPHSASSSRRAPVPARRSLGLLPAFSALTSLGALFLSLAAVNCGDGGAAPGGGGSTSSSSSSSTSSASSSGAGGAGGAVDAAPTMTLTKIKEPTWEFVDFHQSSFVVGTMWEKVDPMLAALLPPPNHKLFTGLGIGPGDAHAAPYTGEISETYAQQPTWKNTASFLTTEALLPNAIIGSWMVIPSAGSPLGKSPDGEMTPIIPNTLFPMKFQTEDFANGTKVLGSDSGFDIPPLDENVDPAFLGVEGHSHYPLFSFRALDDEAVIAGAHERRGSVTDASGAGWQFTLDFKAVE